MPYSTTTWRGTPRATNSARAGLIGSDSARPRCGWCNYSAGMADVRQGGTIGLPAKTLVNASMTLPPFLRMVEM